MPTIGFRSQLAILAGVIIGVGIILWVILLYPYHALIVDEKGDLSNSFSLTVELGLGIFIAFSIFLHERSIREQIKEEKERQVKRYLEQISSSLLGLHVGALTIAVNLKLNGYKDNTSDSELDEHLRWIVSLARLSFITTLNQTKSLISFANSTLDIGFINAISTLQSNIELRVDERSSLALRWQAIASLIEEFADSHFCSVVDTLRQNREFLEKAGK